MTRVIHRNFSKDDAASVGFPLSDHLRDHVHLTNCIHLKNHMHRHSPMLSERSLMRDLIMLQRSRSLRDPSASPPPSWISPSVSSTLGISAARDGLTHSGRRSIGVDRRRESKAGRLSVSSPRAPSFATSKVAAEETSYVNDEVSKEEEDGRKPSKSKGKKVHSKTLSEQLDEAPIQTDTESRRNLGHRGHRKDKMEEDIEEEPELSGHVYCTGLKRMKRRRFRGVRKPRASVDSKSLAQDSVQGTGKLYMGDGQLEDTEMDVSRAPGNGCGIPWNWSRIHHRGKTFLDKAGRSLSCGLSDPRLRKAEGSCPQSQKDASTMPVASDPLTSSTDSDSEALPLLVEPPGSQESTGDHFLVQDYSGELGIYANNSSRDELDTDLESEARSGSHHKSRGGTLGRHRSLTQKYMPRTFKDLVGQNLVVQALSNAVLRRKVGLIYVFYGPHGTGKTSCARVFAKALNCQSMDHPKPCDVCSSCISHNLGKSRNVMEVGAASAFDYENIMEDVLDKALLSPLSSRYRVFIIDDCETLPPDSWSALSKVIDRAPRHVIFILISSSLDHLPHIIISRCQKFFFPKIKDSDIICMLQWIATSDGLAIDKDALKLIASLSDGSLRDAEMTLDQLSLLGQRISLPLVQELVGLVSDEKLVDLLDLALSADTVNTVKSLREIMETGVEPLALMSQLATIITDILAGSYVFTREKLRRKFFRRLTLSREDMEKLRQALKTLSEAEKQLRLSNDKLTWLTAALLQLAPDQHYMLPTSSAHTSLSHSPLLVNNIGEKDLNFANEHEGMLSSELRGSKLGNNCSRGTNGVVTSYIHHGRRNVEHGSESPLQSIETANQNGGCKSARNHKGNERIWRMVLENIQSDVLKQFLFQESRLGSVSFGKAPTARLIFNSPANKAKAEKFRGQILQAFESTLHSEVILEIRCESKKDMGHLPVDMIVPNQRPHYLGSENLMRGLTKDNDQGIGSSHGGRIHTNTHGEITEIAASPRDGGEKGLINGIGEFKEASSLQHQGSFALSHSRESEEQRRRQSLVRGKVSLAHVIQQAEGCAQAGGWSKRKAMSIAEKLEQDNLRLEPRSRSLICWRVPRMRRRKLPHLRIRTQKPRYLLKMVTCGRCLS
ncbi:uncharacterized protein A4U43_C01F34690 [Asparagus officinalis]|uniref:AAA+ ATPase domain-containing protein n=1 Tax=Asparagus officinalis TaxID=4686 RepID=A0A5P1FXQ1_ASPOF|nr:protein STICHEL-like 4 [Asparagus officinalis]XP_020272609.1 protein STICHEL-like 4 [Asparagus officinalis]XP_020272654.1 protein STICHEL-like 4 [Asparagus officinalis]ONK81961.1 uncharacterized protein A4U43_C01F34690 [Asparagus officinalis]